MRKYHFIETWGGIGDAVLSTSVFNEIKLQNPSAMVILICHHSVIKHIFVNNPNIDILLQLNSISGRFLKFLSWLGIIKLVNFNYARLCPGMLYNKRANEIIADIFNLSLTETKLQLFISKEEDLNAKEFLSGIPNPVIMSVTAVSSENKMWDNDKWEELVNTMPEFTFIQLGTKNEVRISGSHDLRGKTSIRESIAIVKNSLSFVGVDSFLSHVTNCYDIPGVILFGPSTPVVWGHSNNINLIKDVLCSPCMDILREGDFCPFNKKCMSMISVEEVHIALLTQIEKSKQNYIN